MTGDLPRIGVHRSTYATLNDFARQSGMVREDIVQDAVENYILRKESAMSLEELFPKSKLNVPVKKEQIAEAVPTVELSLSVGD